MKEKIIKHFCDITPLTDEECDLISNSMVINEYRKGSVLIKEGQMAVDTYFILKGLIREYVLIDGEERTTNFFTEGQWVISLSNFDPQARATHNLECAEDSSLVVGNEREAQEMFKRFPRFETISRVIMEAHFAEQKKFLTSFITESPEQRYLNLLNRRPDIFQRVPQYQIASYIGVKPESLSRIRKRMTQQP